MAKSLLALLALSGLALAGCTDADGDAADAEDQSVHQLHAAFHDQPYRGGQATPMHEWIDHGDGLISFIHWNAEDPASADGIWFVGDGIKAKGCIGSGGISQAQYNAGYVHFHKESAANWDMGHGANPTNPNLMGYWLRHIQVDPDADPMSTGASPVGDPYSLMPSSNAPTCSLV